MENSIKVEFKNLGTPNKNVVTIKGNYGSVNLYFSYKTIVAVNGICSVNDWSKTTGKLLNEIEPDKSKRVKHEEVLKEVEKQLKRVLFSEKELIVQNL